MSLADGALKTAGIGIDVGGTKCLGVVFDGNVVRHRSERATPRGSSALIETLVDIVDELEGLHRSESAAVTASDTLSIGVGLPGLVTREGMLRAAPNLIDVSEFDAATVLHERLGRQVWLDNDATCATVAEWIRGSGRGCTDLAVVTLGTGIGAGFVINGSLVRGKNGFAGEIGHMVVDPHGPPCPCGQRGCWERYASGSGLAHLARSAAQLGSAPSVVDLVPSIDDIRGEDVVSLAEGGAADALAILDDFGRWIALGLSNVINANDPETIVIGGGVIRAGNLLVDIVRSWLARTLYASDHRPIPGVVAAHFAESSGAIGASMLPLAHSEQAQITRSHM